MSTGSTANSVIGRPYSILCVDDEWPVCTAMADVLSLSGYDTVEATSTAQALEIMATQAFDLVISDYSMPPGESGLTLVRKVRELSPATRCIIVSGKGSDAVCNQAQLVGADRYLFKPIKPDDLEEVVSRVLEETKPGVASLSPPLALKRWDDPYDGFLPAAQRVYFNRLAGMHGAIVAAVAQAASIHQRRVYRLCKRLSLPFLSRSVPSEASRKRAPVRRPRPKKK